MALPKMYRLRHPRDFSTVYRRGIRCKTSHLTLRVLRQSAAAIVLPVEKPPSASGAVQRSPSRIGVSISTKVSKRAVVRNRIKRQILAALQQLLPQLLSNWDIVVVVHPQATQCDYQQFLQELKQLLAEAKVLNGHS
ncbi:MAG: ribonuclease P protein component [Scytolyngbya sp. HA4215-MV1]|nr:ribonuclease P protein component [Scytolyngbya sp. HA4215-MV1]